MRPILAALAVSAGVLLAPLARAADLGNRDDAPLHGVQFVDANEGWAVGDEGVVWHTIDGGHTWERQPTGVTASLRALHFLNPYVGWIAGREEQPHGGGSAGVLLFTRDGGERWQRLSQSALPGLNCVRFVDDKTGFVAGDGSEQYPSGLFRTDDCGRTWQPVPGPRCPSWLGADFSDAQNGALAGAWNRLAMLRQGKIIMADLDALGGRSLRGVHLAGKRGVAVGQGGLILVNEDTTGNVWGIPDLGLSLGVRASWDFHAVHMAGNHVWAAGRPGSAVLHSADYGATWEVQHTGQPLPLESICFVDAQHGWAVGDYGTILGTEDGGKTWKAQHHGGQRAALLFIHARPSSLPVGALALLGGQEGYLATAVRVAASDPASSVPGHGAEAPRFAAAVRLAGGAAGETLWQFPVPQHLARADKPALLRAWDDLHGKHAADQLLRQLVLALRVWQPEVVITDCPAARGDVLPDDALVAEAVKEAVARAADPQAFPEHRDKLGLEPWQVAKLYGCWPARDGAQVALDLSGPAPRLEGLVRAFAAPAAALLTEAPAPLPSQCCFRLLSAKSADAASHQDLMEGAILPPGGVARRNLGQPKELSAPALTAIQTRRNLEALAEGPVGRLADPAKVLAELGPTLAGLPPDEGARAAYAVASGFARQGQWHLAREAFLVMVDRYPAHPLAVDAYRWLIRYNGSSEARRRLELGQFLLQARTEFQAVPKEGGGGSGSNHPAKYDVQVQQVRQLTMLGSREQTRRWYEGCLEFEPRLAGFGPLFASDPPVQFCLQAARRKLGQVEPAQKWYARFAAEHPPGPWRELAETELWLTKPAGKPPRPLAPCRLTDTRPFLDGKLDDPCWTAHRPLTLRNAVGDTLKDYPTEVWLAYDRDFLYLALRCRHPADRHVEPMKVRPRDADVRPYDRVSLLLDLDRDYSTYFQLQVDQRGCVCDDCWGDLTWDPRWFVAVHSEPDCWQVEAAIPMIELTGDTVTVGSAWACNVVRVLPGRGVQAWSVPADVQPRPEGMGILMFMQDPEGPAVAERSVVPMTKVP